MRKPGRKREEDKPDLVLKHLLEELAVLDRTRLAKPGMTQAKLDAEKAKDSAEFDRRMAKARAKWERMTILEQKAWGEAYLEDGKPTEGYERTLPAPGDLPDFYAVITIAERDNRKRAKAAKAAEAAEVDPYADHREATGEEHRTPRPTRPSAAPEAPAAHTEPPAPERPRKRRRGLPAVGSIGSQAGGVWYPPIYDEDDFE